MIKDEAEAMGYLQRMWTATNADPELRVNAAAACLLASKLDRLHSDMEDIKKALKMSMAR